MADAGKLPLRASSEAYDDATSAIRAEGSSLEVADEFAGDNMKAIKRTALPMSAEVAEGALTLYQGQGGRRRPGGFDPFHVATVRRCDLPFLTSDRFIVAKGQTLRVRVLPLRMGSLPGHRAEERFFPPSLRRRNKRAVCGRRRW